MIKKALYLLMVMLGLSTISIQASENPDTAPGTPQSVETRDYQRLEKELQEQKEQGTSNVTDHTVKQEAVTPDSGGKISVKRIIINSSEILTVDEILQITCKLEGASVGISELYQMLQEINDLYAKKGFVTAKAVLPPQKIEDGIVRIQLVEAHYGRFLLEGNEHTRDSYILNRLSGENGELVNISTLEREIFYFNRTNDVQLKVELKPGQEFGLTDCVIKVEEPTNIQTSLFSDNQGSINTGEYRLGFTWIANSLTGHRDYLVFSPLGSEGTWAGSIAYNRPINELGTRLGLSYSKNQSSVITGQFKTVNIQSDAADIGITLNHPFRIKPNFKLDGMLSLYNKRGKTDYDNNVLRNNYETNGLMLGVAFQNIDQTGFWYNRFDLTGGEATGEETKNFLRLNFTTVRQQRLNKDRLLTFRLVSQFANQDLINTTEQFSLGGMSTVRGYLPSTLSGDNGYNLSFEYTHPFPSSPNLKGMLFIDHGGTFPYKGNDKGISKEDYLTSGGFGLNLIYSRYSGKIIVGFPFNPQEDQDKYRIDFLLNMNLF